MLGALEDITAVIQLRQVCQEHFNLRPNNISRSWAVKCYLKTSNPLGSQSYFRVISRQVYKYWRFWKRFFRSTQLGKSQRSLTINTLRGSNRRGEQRKHMSPHFNTCQCKWAYVSFSMFNKFLKPRNVDLPWRKPSGEKESFQWKTVFLGQKHSDVHWLKPHGP